MFVVGAYPALLSSHGESSSLAALGELLDLLFGPSVAVHVLPMWPSDGDGGFAVTSWTDIDPSFGTADDLAQIGLQRPLILDGIYNHVAWGHPLAQLFLSDPVRHSQLVHSHLGQPPVDSPLAPRGGSVYRPAPGADGGVHVWQTFGEQAVDLNLDSELVRSRIQDHLQKLVELNVSTVRLDALAYYGKSHSGSPLHNPDGIVKAGRILGWMDELGLRSMLQVDCDEALVHYEDLLDRGPTLVDFSFPTHVVFALLSGKTDYLAEHLATTSGIGPVRVMRPVRTHDGLLMRSGNQPARFLEEVVAFFNESGLQLRYTNGTVYESNHSLPFLLGITDSPDLYFARLLLGLATAVATSDSTYVLLQSLFGDTPELDTAQFPSDPREMQRRPVDTSFAIEGPFGGSMVAKETVRKLATASQQLDLRGSNRRDYKVEDDRGLLTIIHQKLGYRAVLNYSNETRRHRESDAIASHRADSSTLAPYGFVLSNN